MNTKTTFLYYTLAALSGCAFQTILSSEIAENAYPVTLECVPFVDSLRNKKIYIPITSEGVYILTKEYLPFLNSLKNEKGYIQIGKEYKEVNPQSVKSTITGFELRAGLLHSKKNDAQIKQALQQDLHQLNETIPVTNYPAYNKFMIWCTSGESAATAQ